MTTAIFGLVGVLIGGLITWGIDMSIEKRREAGELRQAKRLITSELHTIWVHLYPLVESHRSPRLRADAEKHFLSTPDWHEHRAALAKAKDVSDDQWTALAALFDSTAYLRIILLRKPGEPLIDEEQEKVRQLVELASQIYTLMTGQLIADPSHLHAGPAQSPG